LKQYDSLEETDSDLVFPAIESSRQGDRPELRTPRQLSITVLGGIPSSKGINRSLKLRRKLEVPTGLEGRVAISSAIFNM
jgi:hypothetical protein